MSTNLAVTQLTTGQSNKEAGVNTATGEIDAALTEQLTCNLASGNVTITNSQMRRNVNFIASGVATSGRSITFPAIKRLFSVTNPAGSSNAIDIKVGSTTISLAVGASRFFYADGTTNGLTGIGGAGSIPAGGSTGQILKKASGTDYDTTWGTNSLDNLSNLNITSVADKQTLRYDAASSKWVNSAEISVSTQTTDFTLTLSDAFSVIRMNRATTITLTVPLNSSVAFPVGTRIYVEQTGVGTATIAPVGGGVTLNNVGGTLSSSNQYQMGVLQKIETDTWNVLWYGSGAGGGGGTALSGLSDVAISTPTNGQVLTYDSATSKWKNAASGSGSGALPTGGAQNMFLYKKSGTNYDAEFRMQHPMHELAWNFPSVSGFTTGNIISGGSIADDATFGGINNYGKETAGVNKNQWMRVSKTGAFTIICCVRILWPHKRRYMSAGLWIADTSTNGGRWESWVVSSESELTRYRFGNNTAGSQTEDSYVGRTDVSAGLSGWRDCMWLKVTNDGSGNKKYYASYNGVDWIYCLAANSNDWTTPTHVGMVFNCNQPSNANDDTVVRAHFVYWSLV